MRLSGKRSNDGARPQRSFGKFRPLMVLGLTAAILLGATHIAAQQRQQQAQQRQQAQQQQEQAQAGQRADVAMNTTQMQFPGGQEGAVLTLEQSTPEQARVGQAYPIELSVTNVSEEPLVDVVLLHKLGEGFEYEQAQQQQGQQGQQAQQRQGQQQGQQAQQTGERSRQWEIGNLMPGETKSYQVTAIPTQEGAAASCVTVLYQPAICTAIPVVSPELRLTKAGPDQAYACEEFAYTYQVTNEGTGTARDVIVRDELPKGLQTAEGESTVERRIGELPSGETEEFQVAIRPQDPGQYSSRAKARYAAGEVQSQQVQTRIVEPELEVAIVGPEWVYSNEQANFNVRVTNTSDVPARNAVLRLEGENLNVEQNERKIGNLEPGQSRTMMITAEGAREGEIQIRAAAESACARQVADALTTNIRTMPALVLEAVDNVDPVRIGENTTYTIQVKNQGSAPATNIEISAELPEELSFVEASGDTQAQADGQSINFESIESLSPGEVATWRVVARADSAADTRMRVELNSDYLDSAVPEVEPTRLH